LGLLLAVDIGNTNITIGAFDGGELVGRWSVPSRSCSSPEGFVAVLTTLFSPDGLGALSFDAAIICSVAPALNGILTGSLTGFVTGPVRMVGTDVSTGVRMLVDRPSEVGADRLVNAVAGYAAHKEALIIVDMGTAVTFDVVTEKGEYAGGVIAPGIGISAEALAARTAKLPAVEVTRPARVIGTNTVDCIRSGLYWGFVGLVDGVVEKIIEELGATPRVIATGGAASLLAGQLRYVKECDKDLTLKGLRIIHEGNK